MKILVSAFCIALGVGSTSAAAATLKTEPFGTTKEGKAVTITTMTARDGLTVRFISYGGRITQILAPDRHGHLADIVLGYPTLAQYESAIPTGGPFFGALIGRYANRIASGRFTLDGHTYKLPINNAPNTLHGGPQGFDKKIWSVQPKQTSGSSVSAVLRLTSPDGEAGFPGSLNVEVTRPHQSSRQRSTIPTRGGHWSALPLNPEFKFIRVMRLRASSQAMAAFIVKPTR